MKIGFVISLRRMRISVGERDGKRIRDAALYTFIYHYTFAAKSKYIII